MHRIDEQRRRRVGVQRRGLQAVQRAQECAQLAGRREALLGGGSGQGEFVAGQHRRAPERPRVRASPAHRPGRQSSCPGTAAPGSAIGSSGASVGSQASSRRMPGSAIARRGKRNTRSSPPERVTRKAVLSQPWANGSTDASASSGNSRISRRASERLISRSGVQVGAGHEPLSPTSAEPGQNRRFSCGPNVPMIIRVPICLSNSHAALHPPKGGPCHSRLPPSASCVPAAPAREAGAPGPRSSRAPG